MSITEFPVVALNPVAGDQAYVESPYAVRVVELAVQIVGELTVTTGGGLTVTVAVVVPLQPPEDPVIVYTVVTVGDAITVGPEVVFKLPEGLQV